MLASECNQGRILLYFTSRQRLRQFFELQRIHLAGFHSLGHVDRLEAGGLVRLQLADQVHIGGYHRAGRDFFVYIDEFQSFTTLALAKRCIESAICRICFFEWIPAFPA